MTTHSNIDDYPVRAMISGALSAITFALLLLIATVGAVAVGFWASVASADTADSLVMILYYQDFVAISFVTIVFGLLIGLATPIGLIIAAISLPALILYLRGDRLHIESFFILCLCGITAGFRTANAVYEPHGIGGWRILLAVALPICIYLFMRVPHWIDDLRWRRAQAVAHEVAEKSDNKSIFCPICHGKLNEEELEAGMNRCKHCGVEFNVEEGKI